jgi:hypothetical protein
MDSIRRQQGDVERLAKIAAMDRNALRSEDENGWQPIHEAFALDTRMQSK